MELICTSTRGHGSVELDQLNKGRQTVNFTFAFLACNCCSVVYRQLGVEQVQFDRRCNISKICSYNNFTDIYTNTAQRRMNVYTQSGTT